MNLLKRWRKIKENSERIEELDQLIRKQKIDLDAKLASLERVEGHLIQLNKYLINVVSTFNISEKSPDKE